jgi:hypothetical protein
VTAHSLTHEGGRRSPAGRGSRNGLLQLGWSHFWLLSGILGGMLALVVLVFFLGALVIAVAASDGAAFGQRTEKDQPKLETVTLAIAGMT